MAKHPDNPLRETEMARWREREKKDLETEHNYSPRPLEGLHGPGGTVTPPHLEDGRMSDRVPGHDQDRSENASLSQIPDED